MKQVFSPLFTSLTFPNGVVSKNRVALAAMTHYSSNDDGSTAPEEIPYIKRRSKSAGIVITACYAVTEDGRAYPGEPYIHHDKFIPDLGKIAHTIKQQGALAILQLHHGGGVCPPHLVPKGKVVAPSEVFIPGRSIVTPNELSSSDIEEIIHAFGEATRRAIQAGFDGVELHGAYGYLLQQFISPYSNLRTDNWKIQQQTRFSFPLALIGEVKRIVKLYASPNFLIGYRFTPEEALEPGLTMADALDFTEALVTSGIHFIDVLLNNYRSTPRAGIEDLSRPRLELISKKIAGRIPLFGGGSIYTAEEGLEAFQSGADIITLGREMIIDPEWVEKIETGRDNEIITTLRKEMQDELEIPKPFWKTIWQAPGWFPGTN